jgi:putative oxidoreductase
MKQLILNSSLDWVSIILRLTTGFIMLPHGFQKAFGFFGGFGFKASMHYFTVTMNLPWVISFAVIFFEVIGSIGLIAGAFSRIWAFGLIIVMMGAIITTNGKNGLFMNWYGNQSGEGYEYHLLFIGICLAIVICGSGKFSIDGILLNSK